MSPLAQMLVNAELAVKQSAFPELLSSDCHCFDVSEVRELIVDLVGNVNWKGRNDQRLFLPSPFTWVEHKTNNGRIGALMRLCDEVLGRPIPVKLEGGDWIERPIVMRFASYNADDRALLVANAICFMGRGKSNGHFVIAQRSLVPGAGFDDTELLVRGRFFGAALSLINTPRLIGQRHHMPHAGLQRKIAAAKGMVGKFPLRAWTEIKLEVKTRVDDGAEHEARLSGGKALHFCRAHLRMRFGQVELVSAHWRGDPSLGIKRTRYSVVPPHN